MKPVAVRRLGDAPLLCFGRLSQEKGVADLLHAMQRLPQLRLIIAGDGPKRAKLEQLVDELDLLNVEFAGQILGRDLDGLIEKSRFTVLPSHPYETLGKTILESYAHARAVVATDLGSRRELIYEGKTGLLYKTGDVAELTSALAYLSSQPALADKMGLAGQEQVRHRNTAAEHYEALIALYQRVAYGTDRPRGKLCQVDVKSSATAVVANPITEEKQRLSIAFTRGRGVISEYSGIETYYEGVGERLAAMGHHVTAYCRTYFTPAGNQHNGMQIESWSWPGRRAIATITRANCGLTPASRSKYWIGFRVKTWMT